MARHTMKLARIPIPVHASETFSAWLKAEVFHGSATQIVIYGPAILESHTYTIQVTEDPDATTPVVHTLKTALGTTNVVLPGAGEAFPINELIGTVAFRLKSNAIITDVDKATWKFSAQEEQ